MSHQFAYKPAQFLTITTPYLLVLSSLYLLEQLLWSLSFEGRSQHCHLVQHTTQRPNIALIVIGFLVPYFWGGVVGRACLCVCELVDEVLGNVEICYFGHSVVEEQIGGLYISMYDAVLVQFLQPLKDVVSNLPDLHLRDFSSGRNGFLYSGLNSVYSTCRSPPLANSITMHKCYVTSS